MSTRRPSSRARADHRHALLAEPAPGEQERLQRRRRRATARRRSRTSTGRSSAARASSDSSAAGTVKRSGGCAGPERERAADRRRLHAGQLVEVGEQRRDELGEARRTGCRTRTPSRAPSARVKSRRLRRSRSAAARSCRSRAGRAGAACRCALRAQRRGAPSGGRARPCGRPWWAESMAWRNARPAWRGRGRLWRQVSERLLGLLGKWRVWSPGVDKPSAAVSCRAHGRQTRHASG